MPEEVTREQPRAFQGMKGGMKLRGPLMSRLQRGMANIANNFGAVEDSVVTSFDDKATKNAGILHIYHSPALIKDGDRWVGSYYFGIMAFKTCNIRMRSYYSRPVDVGDGEVSWGSTSEYHNVVAGDTGIGGDIIFAGGFYTDYPSINATFLLDTSIEGAGRNALFGGIKTRDTKSKTRMDDDEAFNSWFEQTTPFLKSLGCDDEDIVRMKFVIGIYFIANPSRYEQFVGGSGGPQVGGISLNNLSQLMALAPFDRTVALAPMYGGGLL